MRQASARGLNFHRSKGPIPSLAHPMTSATQTGSRMAGGRGEQLGSQVKYRKASRERSQSSRQSPRAKQEPHKQHQRASNLDQKVKKTPTGCIKDNIRQENPGQPHFNSKHHTATRGKVMSEKCSFPIGRKDIAQATPTARKMDMSRRNIECLTDNSIGNMRALENTTTHMPPRTFSPMHTTQTRSSKTRAKGLKSIRDQSSAKHET